MAKLNTESKDFLDERRKALKNQIATGFDLVFMGDTHIGMKDNTNRNFYQKVLNNLSSKKSGLVAAFNGGDGVDMDTQNNMETFKKTTENILFKPFKKKRDKIPLFANVGNHEYIPGIVSPAIAFYDSLIGTSKEIQVFRVTPDSKNIKVILEVILLNTGGPKANGFNPADQGIFTSQIAAINKRIADDIKKYSSQHKFVRFIIDMHIPPKVKILGKPPKPGGTPHFLGEPLNRQFLDMLKSQNGNIVAVVTHHRHCMARKVTYHGIPIFITTHAGQTTEGNTRLEYIRLHFKPTSKTYQITNSKGNSFIVNIQK